MDEIFPGGIRRLATIEEYQTQYGVGLSGWRTEWLHQCHYRDFSKMPPTPMRPPYRAPRFAAPATQPPMSRRARCSRRTPIYQPGQVSQWESDIGTPIRIIDYRRLQWNKYHWDYCTRSASCSRHLHFPRHDVLQPSYRLPVIMAYRYAW